VQTIAPFKPGRFRNSTRHWWPKGINLRWHACLGEEDCQIVLIVWKKGVTSTPNSEPQTVLELSLIESAPSGIFSGGGRGVLETLWFESESQLVS